MRRALLALILIAACGDNNGVKPDAGNHHIDAAPAIDAKEFLDAPPPMIVDGTIADVRAATDGAIGFKLSGVTVTYVKPQVGDPTSDPAGFTIQVDLAGPAIFVAVDPTTLPIVPVAGDVVDLTVTQKATVGGQPRVTAVSAITRLSQGADLSAITQNVSASTDLVTALGTYDSELVTVTGTLTGTAGSSGAGFSKFEINTAGITGVTALQLRAPTALMSSIDMTTGCTITATQVPFSEFVSGTTMNAEIDAYRTTDFTLTGCAQPAVTKALATAARTIRVTFTRNIDPTSVLADGTQFTVAGLVVATNPVVSGRTVTLTVTADMVPLTAYAVTVATGVAGPKDLQGSTLTTATANFLGYTLPAGVVINEINPNIPGGCDMVEFRITSDGNLNNFRFADRDGSGTLVNYVFPALQVLKNDFVIVHFAGTSLTCNPAPQATDELTAKNQQPSITNTKNFDSAYDLYSKNTTGLISTTNVWTLYDPTDAIVDAVFGADGTTTTTANATLAQAAVIGTAVQWEPHATSYTDATFRAAAITDIALGGGSNGGTNSQTTNSLQRVTDVDTNSKADWSPGTTGAAPTWGALNVGQTLLP
jgi:hypothetical protein